MFGVLSRESPKSGLGGRKEACCGSSEVTRGGKEVCFGFAHPAAWRAADRGGGSRQAAGSCSSSWIKGKVTMSQWPFLHRSKNFPSSLAPQKVRRGVRGVQGHGCVRTAVLVPDRRIPCTQSRMRVVKPNLLSPSSFLSGRRQRGRTGWEAKEDLEKQCGCTATQHAGHFPPPRCETDSKLDAESSVLAWALPTSSLLPHPHTKRARL